MQTFPIPPASMNRLQAKYAEFEQVALVVAEAMGIDTSGKFRLDMESKQFVTEEAVPVPSNGVAEPEPAF